MGWLDWLMRIVNYIILEATIRRKQVRITSGVVFIALGVFFASYGTWIIVQFKRLTLPGFTCLWLSVGAFIYAVCALIFFTEVITRWAIMAHLTFSVLLGGVFAMFVLDGYFGIAVLACSVFFFVPLCSACLEGRWFRSYQPNANGHAYQINMHEV